MIMCSTIELKKKKEISIWVFFLLFFLLLLSLLQEKLYNDGDSEYSVILKQERGLTIK